MKKRKIWIGLAILLMATLAISTTALGAVDILKVGDGTSPMIFSGTATNTMIVFYTIDDGRFLFWCDSNAQIVDNGDTWDVISDQTVARGVNKAAVTYGYYKYKSIEPVYDNAGNELPIYMMDLGLEAVSGGDLPKSMHIAALKAVSLVDGSPRATVVRKYRGQNYEITDCRVSQVAYDNYLAGKIKLYDPTYGMNDSENKDSYVLVYFISEMFYSSEVEIPVIIDKVIK